MKNCSNDYKQEIKRFGKQQKVKLSYFDNGQEIEINEKNINNIIYSYEGNLLKSVMKELEVETSVELEKDTELHFQYGLLVNGQYEFIDYGNFIVKSIDTLEATNSYKLKCYDKMLYAMKPYEAVNQVFPCHLFEYINAICNNLGYTLVTSDFANKYRMINLDLFKDINYTYRDALDDIAEATGSTIYLNGTNLILGQPSDSGITLEEDSFKDINVNFGEKFGPINTIILSRAGESDNVYLTFPQDLPEEDRIAIKIVENQIMNFNDRADYLYEIMDKMLGLYYYINDYSSPGITYLDLLDNYNVTIGDNTYKCLMLNDMININKGIEEEIHCDIPEVGVTDYTKADKTDQRINQTTLIVDKQNQKIEGLITSDTTQNQRIASLHADVEELKSEIGDIADITITDEGYGGLEMDGINQSEPIYLRIHPTGLDITPLYPKDTLYPSDTLYPHDREIYFKLKGETAGTFDDIQIYNIPANLYWYSNEVFDEFILDYENQRCQVIHRVSYDPDTNTKTPLQTEVVEDFTYPYIPLQDGDYIIIMPAFETGYIYCRLMAQNIYTKQFATRAELNSKIAQTEFNISLEVDEKLTNYVTETEMSSAINISADAINSVVRTKVGEDEVISKINQSSEEVQINANKISLVGKTLDCRTENIDIISGNIKINNDSLMFIDNNVELGGIRSSHYAYDSTQKGVSFRLNSRGKYMSWSVEENNENIVKLFYVRAGSFGHSKEGIYLGTDMYTDGYYFYVTDTSYIGQINNGGIAITNKGLTSGSQIFGIWYYNDSKLEVYNDGTLYVNGNVYANNISSDGRKKKNIKESTTDAIELIKQIPHRQFDWKVNNNHVSIGYIAQEMEEISTEFITKRNIEDADGKIIDQEYYMNELPLIATATKAIQEQQTIIDNLQDMVLEQNELLNKIKEELNIKTENKVEKNIKKLFKKQTIKQYDDIEIKIPEIKKESLNKTKIIENKNGVEIIKEGEK